MIKSVISSIVKLCGYELIPNWRMPHLEFSRYLSGLFRDRGIQTVIDVGANVGQYRHFMRTEVKFTGQILSYEPHPGCYAELREKSEADPFWEVRNLALGDRAGELSLNVMESSDFNSFLVPTHEHADMSKLGNRIRERVAVRVSTLDTESQLENLRDSVYLKLDTQGFDLNVLRGAESFLRRVAALQTELSVKQIYEGMPDFREVMQFLESRGFALGATFPVTRDHQGAIVEFDGVFVRVPSLTVS